MSDHVSKGENMAIAFIILGGLFIVIYAVMWTFLAICSLDPQMCGLDYADLESGCYRWKCSYEMICLGSQTKMCPLNYPPTCAFDHALMCPLKQF
jgi:hypothetical protein